MLAFLAGNPFADSSDEFDASTMRVTLRKDGQRLATPSRLLEPVCLTMPSAGDLDPASYTNFSLGFNDTAVFPVSTDPPYGLVFLHLYAQLPSFVWPSEFVFGRERGLLNGNLTLHLFKGNAEQAKNAITDNNIDDLKLIWSQKFKLKQTSVAYANSLLGS